MSNRFPGDAEAAGLGQHLETHTPKASFQNSSGGGWWLAGNRTLASASLPPWVPFFLILILRQLVSHHLQSSAAIVPGLGSPSPC